MRANQLAGIVACALAAGLATGAQTDQRFAQRTGAKTPLGQMSEAFTELARRVNASVVRIISVGYRPVDEGGEPGISTEQPSGGSGVVIDSSGLIVTNAHVVLGAQKLRVVLSPQLNQGARRESILQPSNKVLTAELLGLDFETDLALLKVAMPGLPALKLGDSDTVQPGQIVLAFGSPLGLQNSVTMGVVSSPARQLRPEDPMIYIQTDASINPGNSGGPLVNTDGEVIGVNTMIASQSGGSEGIGFAAPSNIVANVVRHIRERGRMVRGEIGVYAQTIEPTMAAALKLSRPYGVILSDVYPGGPADEAGLQPGDIVVSLDGKPMENARQFRVNLYRPAIGDMVRLEIQRGRDTRNVPVQVVERPNDPGRFASLITTPANKIEQLGVFGLDITPEVRGLLPELRKGLGVLVASRAADAPYLSADFEAGDVIYQVNGEPVTRVEELKSVLGRLESGAPVAVQIERRGRLRFLVFEMP